MIESASGLLSLPRLGPEVPVTLEAAEGVTDVAAIAAGLYRAGLLKSEDAESRLMYTLTGGGLIQTVTNALQRNLAAAIGDSELYESMQLMWSNRILERVQGGPEIDDNKRYGAFFVIAGAPDVVVMKPGIEALEAYEPGFGYSLAAVLYQVLEFTGNCWSYPFAHYLRNDWWCDYYENYFGDREVGEENEPESEEQTEFLEARNPDKGLPPEFRRLKYNARAVRRAASRPTDNEYQWLAKVALSLTKKGKPLESCRDGEWIRFDSYQGTVMRYSEEDAIGTLFDDFAEHLTDGGEECDMVWCAAFCLEPDEVDASVDEAVKKLVEWFRLVTIAAKLWVWFDDAYRWEDNPEIKERVRV